MIVVWVSLTVLCSERKGRSVPRSALPACQEQLRVGITSGRSAQRSTLPYDWDPTSKAITIGYTHISDKVWWLHPARGVRRADGGTGGSKLARPAPIAAAPPRAAWRRQGIALDRYFVRVAILPTFAVMLGVFGMPLAFSFYLSFTGYAQGQGLFSGGYVGLENYQDLLSDPVFTGSIASPSSTRRPLWQRRWYSALVSRCC